MKIQDAILAYKLVQLNEMGEDPFTSEVVLTEDRLAFVKAKYQGKLSTEHDPMADHKNTDSIVDHLASVDPTKKKVYTQWLTHHYSKGGFKQEDAYRVGESLGHFDRYKSKLDNKDINSYTPASLKAAVKPFIGTAATNAEKKAEVETKGRTKVWEDDNIAIHRLENSEDGIAASKEIYGGGSNLGGCHTDWCTAARSDNNMFKRYSDEGPLHVIHHKGKGKDGHDEVYQYHTSTNSFMDKEDNPITYDRFQGIKDSLHKAWTEKPELLK